MVFSVRCRCALAGILRCLLATYAISTAAMQQDLPSQGKDLVAAMAARQFDKVEAHFDSRMSSVLPANKLAAGWDAMIVRGGGFKSIVETRQEEIYGHRVVYVTCQFEKRKADVRLAFDAQGQVTGLRFLPTKSESSPGKVSPRLRPQNPERPYPYHEEDVSYDNKVQGNKLAATLTIPQGKGPFPAVVLITGSGPQDRDESLMGHKPFLVLADSLTRKGVAVLRADDRGVGKSTGEFSGATTADFATDTEAGIAYLKTRPEIAKMIGLIGHSEGGVIAPMVAARNPDVAFIVMLAGSGVPGEEIIVTQAELLTESAGKSHDEAMKAGAKQRKILEIVKENADDALLEKQLREELAGEMSEAQVGALVQQLNLRWVRYFITYDPATALKKVTCPVLALNGAKDRQVPPKQNLPAIRKALEAGGNKNFEVDELPGLNHLFQTAKTGAPSEYPEIEETMSPGVLQKIADWILKLQH